jgi:ribosome-binding factor A
MSTRQKRVGEMVLRELGQLFQRGKVRDPEIGFVTFTGVDMSPDLRLARVYYSVFGSDAENERCQGALDRARPFVRREVAKALHLKVVPEIEFKADHSIEQGARIERLLREVAVSDAPQAQGDERDENDDDDD